MSDDISPDPVNGDFTGDVAMNDTKEPGLLFADNKRDSAKETNEHDDLYEHPGNGSLELIGSPIDPSTYRVHKTINTTDNRASTTSNVNDDEDDDNNDNEDDEVSEKEGEYLMQGNSVVPTSSLHSSTADSIKSPVASEEDHPPRSDQWSTNVTYEEYYLHDENNHREENGVATNDNGEYDIGLSPVLTTASSVEGNEKITHDQSPGKESDDEVNGDLYNDDLREVKKVQDDADREVHVAKDNGGSNEGGDRANLYYDETFTALRDSSLEDNRVRDSLQYTAVSGRENGPFDSDLNRIIESDLENESIKEHEIDIETRNVNIIYEAQDTKDNDQEKEIEANVYGFQTKDILQEKETESGTRENEIVASTDEQETNGGDTFKIVNENEKDEIELMEKIIEMEDFRTEDESDILLPPNAAIIERMRVSEDIDEICKAGSETDSDEAVDTGTDLDEEERLRLSQLREDGNSGTEQDGSKEEETEKDFNSKIHREEKEKSVHFREETICIPEPEDASDAESLRSESLTRQDPDIDALAETDERTDNGKEFPRTQDETTSENGEQEEEEQQEEEDHEGEEKHDEKQQEDEEQEEEQQEEELQEEEEQQEKKHQKEEHQDKIIHSYETKPVALLETPDNKDDTLEDEQESSPTATSTTQDLRDKFQRLEESSRQSPLRHAQPRPGVKEFSTSDRLHSASASAEVATARPSPPQQQQGGGGGALVATIASSIEHSATAGVATTGNLEEDVGLPEKGITKNLVAQWRQIEIERNERASGRSRGTSRSRDNYGESSARDEILRMRSQSCDPEKMSRGALSLFQDANNDHSDHSGYNDLITDGSSSTDDQYRSQPSLTKAMMAKFEHMDAGVHSSEHSQPPKKTFKWEVKEVQTLSRPVHSHGSSS